MSMQRLRGTAFQMTLLLAAALLWTVSTPGSPVAHATAARLVSQSTGTGRLLQITVYSPAMDRNIPLQVLRPADTSTPAPTLYLLNGAGGGEDAASWVAQTDLNGFFADKQVNIVVPMEGAFSYYTDWQQDDAGLGKKLGNNGRNKWATFLTEELPPVIDRAFGTNGVNGLAGISMAGTSVLDLAIQAPELYRGVAAYSGCAMTSDPLGQSAINFVISLGGGRAQNMWGPLGGPEWREHDVLLHADRLPNIPMYISSGTGMPGPHDALADPTVRQNTTTLANQMLIGGGIEATAHYCTTQLAARTNALGRTDITYSLDDSGTHSWGYWQDELHKSWPILGQTLGV
ncbi:MAG: putative esterase [Nocardia sp.]|uniref:alpha/beta hydrolase n=1 Tax=Nocardia sp. TaxID=1821 RepID=UPI002636CCB5|nr:alpha/beta hydrolase family protein [Nocardia sp.]MCU1641523.1 putative esterase [Nocardia sp.]